MNLICLEYMRPAKLQSLQQLAAVKLTISVCESADMQRMIGNFSKANGDASVGYSDYQWEQLRRKAFNMLVQNGVPQTIIDAVLEKMWPISFEIFKWIIYHVKDTDFDYSSQFCWTKHGNIHYEKTAILMVKNEALNLKKRFKLACIYCLDHEVRSLWQKMSLAQRRYFFVRGNLKISNLNQIILYWTYYIQEVPIVYWTSKTFNHTQLFKFSVENGYLRATKYFLKRLTIHHQNRMVLNSLRVYICQSNKLESYSKGSYFYIAWFLISVLTFYRRMFSFKLALRCFLEWPLQKKFMAVVSQVRNFIYEISYSDLLTAIFEKDFAGFRDHDYKKLFKEFWLQGKSEHKTYVNEVSKVGFELFFRFTVKHFGFIFDENSNALKMEFRSIVFQRKIPEDSAFPKKDVMFFQFLIREYVTTKATIQRYTDQGGDLPFNEFDSFYDLPSGEVMYLIDNIIDM